MTKRLDEAAVQGELAASTFFQARPTVLKPATESKLAGRPAGSKAAVIAPEQASQRASTLAGADNDLVERIRKAVKGSGKEVSYVRLTPEERLSFEHYRGQLIQQMAEQMVASPQFQQM